MGSGAKREELQAALEMSSPTLGTKSIRNNGTKGAGKEMKLNPVHLRTNTSASAISKRAVASSVGKYFLDDFFINARSIGFKPHTRILRNQLLGRGR